MSRFWIEEDNQYITLYINAGISKRIVKEKCPKEKQLEIVLGWLEDMNQYSSFVYGKFGRANSEEEE